MKIIYGGFFILFTVLTISQFTASNAFLWIIIYGITALTSLLRIFGVWFRNMVFLLLIAIGVYTLLFIPFFWEWVTSGNKFQIIGELDEEYDYLEGTRDFFGLLLVDLSLAFHLYWRRI